MDDASTGTWIQIGEWRLTPALNLLAGRGQEVRLEPRHVDLLVFLANRQGEVVSAEEILAEVWRGFVVGDHSVYQAIAKLRKALGDDATQARYIETVPKRGYRLVAQVGRPAARAPEPRASTERGRTPRVRRLAWKGGSLAALLALAALLLWRLVPGPSAPPPSPRHSLAVLPFESLSPDAADGFVAQGFAIELAALIGSAKDLLVLGPVSTRLTASEGVGPIETAKRLDADILVSGSLRRSASQLRISATLTDGRSGAQLWSRIFERGDGDVFEVQRSVAAEIVRALDARLGLQDTAGKGGDASDDKDAYDDFLLGQYYRSIRSAASLKQARGFFERALAKDPDFAQARRDLATTDLLLSFYGDLPLREALERAEPLLKECLEVTPADAELQGAIGLSHYLKGAFGLAEEYLRRAVAASPSYVEGWMWLGLSERQQGRLLDALDAFEHARTLEPLMVTTAINNANALAWSGRPAEARTLLKDLTQRARSHPQLDRVLSNIELELGDLPAAHAWASEALKVDPKDALSRANMAMILSYLGREDAARALVADVRSSAQHGRAVQLYLDLLALTEPELLPANMQALYDSRLQDSPSLPEIEWRLANARIGLADYFSGRLDAARERLERSLAGRVYPIQRTDYDVFVCTSLADAERRLDGGAATSRWLRRCEADFEEAAGQGWRSLAMGYVAVRLSMLRGEPEEAIRQLDTAVERGFRNRKLLRTDPVLAPLRDRPAFQAGLKALDARVDGAWSQILERCGGPEVAGCLGTDQALEKLSVNPAHAETSE